MSARIVRHLVEADDHIDVLVPYRLYQEVLRFMRGHHVQATMDETVAHAVQAYLEGRARGLTG